MQLFKRRAESENRVIAKLSSIVIEHQFQTYRQLECLIQLLDVLRPKRPLSPLRGWAISPDCALLLAGLILERRPRVVVELGTGVSTIVCGYALQQAQSGELITVEHSPRFATDIKKHIVTHELDSLVTVVEAPLVDVVIGQEKWRWYCPGTIDSALDNKTIDMLFVDGPPAIVGKLARYPALPLLARRFTTETVVVVDDGMRTDEKNIVRRWVQEYSYRSDFIPHEKGTYLLGNNL